MALECHSLRHMTDTEIIKQKLSIVDIAGSYLKLERSGSSYRACCPFHNEKTPSFFISPDRGNYYCFGCGAKGDIFSLTEHLEVLDFKGALKFLEGLRLGGWVCF
jgi:DNA primase